MVDSTALHARAAVPPAPPSPLDWRETDAGLELSVPPGPPWRPTAWFLVLLAFQTICILLTMLMVALMPYSEGQTVHVLLGGLALWLLCAGRALWKARRVRVDRRPGAVRVSARTLSVVAPPWAGGAVTAWPKDGIVDVSCQLIGVVPTLQQHLEVAVVLADGRVERASIPWPPELDVANVTPRLRAALGVPRAAVVPVPAVVTE